MAKKLKKISVGDYELALGNRTVSITRFSKAQGASFTGWLARANWDKTLVTDPVPTLQQARRAAERMFKEGGYF